jgi:hypothetical protein
MADPTIPRIVRLGAGRYVVSCGDSAVHVWHSKQLSAWVATPQTIVGEPPFEREVFDSAQEAKEWAYDWLGEYA